MRKKIFSLFLVFVLSLSLVIIPAGAVLPIAFAQAALASYVASTGYKMWIDNGTGRSLLGLASDLYDLYLQTHPEAMTLGLLLEGNFIYPDNQGNIVLSKTAADTFQGFCNWIRTEYSVEVGGSAVTVLHGVGVVQWPFQESGSVTAYKTIDPYIFVNTILFEEGFRFKQNSAYNDLLTFLNQHGNDLVIVSYPTYDSPYEGTAGFIAAYPVGTYDIPSNLRIPAGSYLSFRGTISVTDNVHLYTLTRVIPNTSYSSVTYRYGRPLIGEQQFFNSANVLYQTSGGLAVSLAQSMLDKAYDIAEGYSLVIDVGAVGNTADDVIDAVAVGYDAATGAIPVSDAVVSDVVIDTPVQNFPDMDDLGLPQLGEALTRRFPFCIPWDLVATWDVLTHEPIPPTLTIDLIPSSLKSKIGVQSDTSFEFNLASPAFGTLLFLIRWGCIIGFCLSLERLTKRYIWTTGG